MNNLNSPKNYKISIIDKKIAKKIIIENHYSHKWSSCRYAFGLFNENKVIGVAVYGSPIGRQAATSITSDLGKDDVLELTRLWLEDEAPKNSESFFIGKTFSWLRKNTKIKVLLSYSDPMFNHVGTIYQATNWLYQGNNIMLIKAYYHRIKGVLMHPRSVVSIYGSTNPNYLKGIDPLYERIEMKKKHRYIYILHKRDRKKIIKNLKHKIVPYPKNNLDCCWDNNKN